MRALPASAAARPRDCVDRASYESPVRSRPVAMWGSVGEKRELFPHELDAGRDRQLVSSAETAPL